ncbi:MAG: phosphate signaling complex protein PhoU [Chloroflexi bacterium]|nr:phosphate signaling complex protein PhoU [Chloroflexota bacterium]
MPREAFAHQLTALHNEVLLMGGEVRQNVARALRSLQHRDQTLLSMVDEHEANINERRIRIEQESLRLLATQAPVASDLRAITAAMAIASELERVGDYAAGIGRISACVAQLPPAAAPAGLFQLAWDCDEQLRLSLTAYGASDVELAKQAIAWDQTVNQLYQTVLQELLADLQVQHNGATFDTYLSWVAHNLERMGDRTANIAERVVYQVTSCFIEPRDVPGSQPRP